MTIQKIDLLLMNIIVIIPSILFIGNKFVMSFIGFFILAIYYFYSQVSKGLRKKTGIFGKYISTIQITGILIGSWLYFSPSDKPIGVMLGAFIIIVLSLRFVSRKEFKEIIIK